MSKYTELKQKHEKEFNEFPIFFAFSNKQFEEGMAKFGLKPTDTDKIYRFGNSGGYYLRTDNERLCEMLKRYDKELQDTIDADSTGEGFIFEMFDYELADHEYIVTYDISSTLDALDLTLEDIKNDKRLQHGLKLAKESNVKRYGKYAE